MTRINVGVPPHELCDQHLIAEYRELPRLWNFKPKSRPPREFCLGKGHVLWCAQYPRMLYQRYLNLVYEMRHRGFTVNYPLPPEAAGLDISPTTAEVARACGIVRDRLKHRMSEMNSPRWTKRDQPTWWASRSR